MSMSHILRIRFRIKSRKGFLPRFKERKFQVVQVGSWWRHHLAQFSESSSTSYGVLRLNLILFITYQWRSYSWPRPSICITLYLPDWRNVWDTSGVDNFIEVGACWRIWRVVPAFYQIWIGSDWHGRSKKALWKVFRAAVCVARLRVDGEHRWMHGDTLVCRWSSLKHSWHSPLWHANEGNISDTKKFKDKFIDVQSGVRFYHSTLTTRSPCNRLKSLQLLLLQDFSLPFKFMNCPKESSDVIHHPLDLLRDNWTSCGFPQGAVLSPIHFSFFVISMTRLH